MEEFFTFSIQPKFIIWGILNILAVFGAVIIIWKVYSKFSK